MKRQIHELFLYKYRYIISYSLIIIVFGLVIFGARFAVGGLSNSEIESAVSSVALNNSNFLSSEIINWPFKLLQRVSIDVLGLSVLSVKLPAMILAFLSGAMLLWLFLKWFKPSIAVLALAISITTGQFLFYAQNGTPGMLYILYTLAILLLGLLITTNKRFYYILVPAIAFILGLSLYTPLMIYIALMFLVICAWQPRLRFYVKSMPLPSLLLGIAVFIATITPLAIASSRNLTILSQLLGQGIVSFDIWSNLSSLAVSFFSFNSTEDNYVLTPIFAMPAIALAAYGIYSSARQRHTARTYATFALTLVAIAILIFAPNKYYLAFVPIAMLIAVGLETLLNSWYTLFPQNPYARVGGLALVLFLVISMCVTSVERFALGYRYTPQVARHHSSDISLVRQHLREDAMIITPDGKIHDFYKILQREHSDLIVTTELTSQSASRILVLDGVDVEVDRPIHRIVTSGSSKDSSRIHIYR